MVPTNAGADIAPWLLGHGGYLHPQDLLLTQNLLRVLSGNLPGFCQLYLMVPQTNEESLS